MEQGEHSVAVVNNTGRYFRGPFVQFTASTSQISCSVCQLLPNAFIANRIQVLCNICHECCLSVTHGKNQSYTFQLIVSLQTCCNYRLLNRIAKSLRSTDVFMVFNSRIKVFLSCRFPKIITGISSLI